MVWWVMRCGTIQHLQSIARRPLRVPHHNTARRLHRTARRLLRTVRRLQWLARRQPRPTVPDSNPEPGDGVPALTCTVKNCVRCATEGTSAGELQPSVKVKLEGSDGSQAPVTVVDLSSSEEDKDLAPRRLPKDRRIA